jgi:hypothetical protein
MYHFLNKQQLFLYTALTDRFYNRVTINLLSNENRFLARFLYFEKIKGGL